MTKDVNWHFNQKGTFSDFGIADHSVVGPGMEIFGNVSKGVKVVGKVALPVAVAVDAYSIYNSDNKPKEVSRVVGGWTGALAGGEVGAAAGTMVFPGIGTAVGGFVGGIAGSVGGYFVGSSIGTSVYNFFK